MAQTITRLKLRRLQTLWSAKMRKAGIPALDDSRELRHQYIHAATGGRAATTNELSVSDARDVIDLLSCGQRGLEIGDAETAQAAGLHGRRGRQAAHEVMAGAQQ